MNAGVRQAEITFIKTTQDREGTLTTVPDYTLSTKRGIGLGAIAGLLIGILQLLYIDSPALMTWPRILTLVFWQSFGWAIFGMIVGCGGLFASRAE